MARPPSPDVQLRNLELLSDIKHGMSPSDAARKYGMSRSMVSQILTASTETEEEIPQEVRSRLIHLADRSIEIAIEIAEGPGRAITSGKGDHVLDGVTGEPAYDPSPRLDALRQIDAASSKLAKLTAAEKPPAKIDAEEVPAWHESVAQMKQTADENAELKNRILQLEAQIRALEDAHPAQIVT